MTVQRQSHMEPLRAPGGARRFSRPTAKAMRIAVTASMHDYAIDSPEAVTVDPWIESLTMLGHPCHYRLKAREPYGSGEMEFCALGDGFFVHIADVAFDNPSIMSVTAPDIMRVRIASEGEGEYAPARGDSTVFKGPSAALIIEPANQSPAYAAFAGRNRAVHVYIHRDTLKQLYAGGERELPPVAQAFVHGALQATVARPLPLTPALLRCLEDLQSRTLEGHSRRLFIRSKAVEILCHAFAALEEEDGDSTALSSTTAARGVMRAQRLLMENFVAPPSLDDLASEVGLSRTSLCVGFRQILGQSVYDYINDLRMQHALALLAERNASITQIAYAVGYNYPSSFSVAVQRRFGATPRELRRRGALPTM